VSEEVDVLEEVFSSRGRVKVLRVLTQLKELNISEIARRTNLSHTAVERHLEKLKQLGLVTEKRFGRIRIFRFNSKNPIASAVEELFMKVK